MDNIYNIESEIVAKMTKEINSKIEHFIIDKLKLLGFSFANNIDLVEFAKNRLTRINHQSSDLCEIYLDFNTKNQQLVCVYSEDVDINLDGLKATCTIKIA